MDAKRGFQGIGLLVLVVVGIKAMLNWLGLVDTTLPKIGEEGHLSGRNSVVAVVVNQGAWNQWQQCAKDEDKRLGEKLVDDQSVIILDRGTRVLCVGVGPEGTLALKVRVQEGEYKGYVGLVSIREVEKIRKNKTSGSSR